MKKLFIGMAVCLQTLFIAVCALADVAIDEAHFPDDIFRAYVSQNFDWDQDGALTDDEAMAAQVFSLDNSGVKDLTGLSFFPYLEKISCSNCGLTALDVSGNPQLVDIRCEGNAIQTLDVSQNPSLLNLYCASNRLTSLDVSHNPSLQQLYCQDNRLTELILYENHPLKTLNCANNQLTFLDLFQTGGLRRLYCNDNQLTSLNISQTSMSDVHSWNNEYDFSNNVRAITAEGGVFDLSTLPGMDLPRASYWTGCIVEENTLIMSESGEVTYDYDIGKTYHVKFTLLVTVTGSPVPTPGDATGDGKVTLNDVVRLLKYVSGWDVTVTAENCDVTGDGQVTLSDVVRLLKFVSGWDVELR